jgi:hypothetical protein
MTDDVTLLLDDVTLLLRRGRKLAIVGIVLVSAAGLILWADMTLKQQIVAEGLALRDLLTAERARHTSREQIHDGDGDVSRET